MKANNVTNKLTKLITTIGPASEPAKILREVFLSGSTCVRLNFSHGDNQEHGGRIIDTRKFIKETGMPISLMLDTKGPEIRTGNFIGGKIDIQKGDVLHIDCFNVIEGNSKKFSIDYPNLMDDLKIGSIILLDDGKIQLKVLAFENKLIKVEALNHHVIKNRRGVNLPGTILSLPFLSAKDKQDLKFACDNNFDFIAASFVRNAADVNDLKSYIHQFPNGKNIKIISKIESQQAMDAFDEILEASDMIMVARGDLGIEVPYQLVPHYQKTIIQKCIISQKPSIVATQMLDSMVSSPQPTRAEVTDVYWAAELGASSTMLSGESANGDYPILATFTMANITKTAQDYIFINQSADAIKKNVKNIELKKIIDAVMSNKLQTLIAINPSYEDITAIAGLHLKLQIIVITNDQNLFTKFGVHFGVKTIFANDLIKLNTQDEINALLCSKHYIDATMKKVAFLKSKFIISQKQ